MLLGPTLAAVSLTLVDATTAEVRSLPDGRSVALDLSTSPGALLSVSGRRSAWSFGYAPRIALLNVTRDSELAVFHNAFVGYAWWHKRLRLTAAVNGSFGAQSVVSARNPAGFPATDAAPPIPGDMTPAPAAPPPPADLTSDPFLPQREVLETGSVGVSLGLGYQMARRWNLSLGTSYDISGGVNDSKPLIPLQRTAAGSASVGHNLTRRDDLETTLSSAVTDVPDIGSRFLTITLLETWGHRFGRRSNGSLGAGATYLRARATRRGAIDNSIQANGSASFSQGFLLSDGATLTALANVTVDTGYNQLLGVVGQRVSGTASLSWERDRTTASAQWQTSQTLPVNDPSSALSYGAGVSFGYRVADPFQLTAGGSWSHQVLPDSVAASGASPDQWGAFVGFTLTLPILGG